MKENTVSSYRLKGPSLKYALLFVGVIPLGFYWFTKEMLKVIFLMIHEKYNVNILGSTRNEKIMVKRE
jgi:hypothetical protein